MFWAVLLKTEPASLLVASVSLTEVASSCEAVPLNVKLLQSPKPVMSGRAWVASMVTTGVAAAAAAASTTADNPLGRRDLRAGRSALALAPIWRAARRADC